MKDLHLTRSERKACLKALAEQSDQELAAHVFTTAIWRDRNRPIPELTAVAKYLETVLDHPDQSLVEDAKRTIDQIQTRIATAKQTRPQLRA